MPIHEYLADCFKPTPRRPRSVFDVGEFALAGGDAGVYVVMELISGVPLSSWLAAGRGRQEILQVMTNAGRGLAAAHAAGIVHGDFKPGNVLIADDGRVVVLDFGLAIIPERETTDERPASDATAPQRDPAKTVAGTPAYMAPEHHAGFVTAASDQFSYCVTLYEALVGARPFAGANAGLCRAKLEGPAAIPPGLAVGRRISSAVRRGLAADPRQRFGSMDALLRQLSPRRRWPIVAAVAGTLVTGVTGLSVGGALADDDPLSCDRPTDELIAQSWSERARSAFLARAAGAPAAEAAVARLDAYAEAWRDARRDACADEQTGSKPAILACLEHHRRELEGTLEVLADSETSLQRADRVVAGLEPPRRCVHSQVVALEGANP